jgi:trk system potassium uptake protein
MQVVITGCGRTGRALATRLDAEGDKVTVVELDDAVRSRLPAGFRGRFLPGNGINPRVLEAAGIAHAEAFVALTPNDSANIVAARVARDIYRVPHVLARLHDPAHAPVYTEFGIATVGSVQTTVNRVIQLLHHQTLKPHQTFGNGETLLVRSRVPDYLAGRRVADFNVPGEIGVVELSRAGTLKSPSRRHSCRAVTTCPSSSPQPRLAGSEAFSAGSGRNADHRDRRGRTG